MSKRPYLSRLRQLFITFRPLSVDETGDYIEWKRHACGLIYAEKYGTVFNVRRSAPYEVPQVDFTYGRRPVPPQPQPVSVGPASLIGSWLGYLASQSLTGDQIDALRKWFLEPQHAALIGRLVGGPDRPIPTPKPQRPQVSDTTSGNSGTSQPGSVADVANSASRGVSDLYSRLNNALQERGYAGCATITINHLTIALCSEMLGGLEESFQSLESGSKNMLAQVCLG